MKKVEQRNGGFNRRLAMNKNRFNLIQRVLKIKTTTFFPNGLHESKVGL